MPNNDDALEANQPKPEEGNKKPKAKPAAKKTDSVAKPRPVKAAAAQKPAERKPAVETKTPVEPAAPTETLASVAAKGAIAQEPVEPVVPVVSADESRRKVKSTVIKVTAVVVAALVVVLVIFGVLIYGYKSDSPVVRAVARVVPYPVEKVNGSFVTYNSYLFEVDANKRAYENNAKLNNQPAVDFKSSDGKKLMSQIRQHSLQKLQSDALTAQLASQKKVKVTDKEVNDLINQLYDRYGGKDTLLKTLSQIYGWNLHDLKKVVYTQLLSKDLSDKVTSDPTVDAAAKAKAQDVLAKVKNNGDFGALAKQYSQASDAASGGDMGFVTKGQLPDNVQAAVDKLQVGQVSDALKTAYGYQIVKLVEKKDDGSVHVQEILIKTIDFNEYFQDQLKKAKINTYVKV